MNDESTNNNTDLTALIQEIQILNESTVSNGERLDEITEYLITQDKLQSKKESDLKKAQEEQSEKDIKANEEKEQAQQEQTETYTELLQNVSNQLEVQNALLSGQNFMSGIICGVLLFTILWNKINL